MNRLEKRLQRWVNEWVQARAAWVIQLRKDDYFTNRNATPEHLDTLEKMTYCEEKFMDVLVTALKKGQLSQADVDRGIYHYYPQVVEQSDNLIQEWTNDNTTR